MSAGAFRRATLVALALSLATPPAAAQDSGELAIDPELGPPGTTVSVTGSFPGFCGVRIYWDAVGGTALGDASAGPDGGFARSIQVPPDAPAGSHLVVAVGLTWDRDGLCLLESDTTAEQPFEVVVQPPPTAKLKLPKPQVQPGEGIVLDATESLGQIVAWEFDLDGNGSHETKCGSAKAATVHNTPGPQTIGLKVVAADGQTATDSVVLSVAGAAAPPPPAPGGGTITPFQTGTIAGTCIAEAQLDVDALIKAWMCPSVLVLGVVEATFRKWGINPASEGACFERKEGKLFGTKIKTTSFVATKPSPVLGPWQQTPVLINGLELAHPEGHNNYYANDLAINETLQTLSSYGGKKIFKDYEWQITMRSSEQRTSFATEPFLWDTGWSIAKPITIGTFTIGSDFKKPFAVNNELLGLTVAEKQTPIVLSGDRRATLTAHVRPPFWEFKGTLVPTSAVGIVTDNNGGHPTAFPKTPSGKAPSNLDLQFKGVKLGFLTIDAALSYQEQGGDDVWSGGMDVLFPGGVKIGGTLTIRNGSIEKAYFDYTPGPPGIGPIACCVWLHKIFGELGNASVTAGADLGLGPTIPVLNAPPAQATGQASIIYGDPWAFVMKVSGLKIVGLPVQANADVFVNSNGFLAFAFIDEDWGFLELKANVQANVGAGGWFVGGGGSLCVDIEVVKGCGGAHAGVGKNGLSACAVIPYLPDAGVTLYWSFLKLPPDLGAWDWYWGCSFGHVKQAVGAKALERARWSSSAGLAATSVKLPDGLPKALFAIEGAGGPPKVTLTSPKGATIASAPGEALISGPGWYLLELDRDDATYVVVEKPAGGAWKIAEQAGSVPISSIGTAEGLPKKIAKGKVAGKGLRRTLRYRVAKVPGVEVTFVERAGDPASGDPSQVVERILGTRGPGKGKLRFTPAEHPIRKRKIEAVVHVDGFPTETETVAKFRAPKRKPLPKPRLSARRGKGALRLSWPKIPGTDLYRVEIERSDGADELIDLLASKRRAKIGGVGSLTTARVTVRAISPAGYVGKPARVVSKAPPPLTIARRATIRSVLAARGFRAACLAAADGVCEVEVRRGKKLLARGKKAVEVGQRRAVRVRLTAAGRKLLAASSGLRLSATAAVPGYPSDTLRIRLTR